VIKAHQRCQIYQRSKRHSLVCVIIIIIIDEEVDHAEKKVTGETHSGGGIFSDLGAIPKKSAKKEGMILFPIINK
jgi:hypothetical protein